MNAVVVSLPQEFLFHGSACFTACISYRRVSSKREGHNRDLLYVHGASFDCSTDSCLCRLMLIECSPS